VEADWRIHWNSGAVDREGRDIVVKTGSVVGDNSAHRRENWVAVPAEGRHFDRRHSSEAILEEDPDTGCNTVAAGEALACWQKPVD
jgi:hypothetical protein